MREGDGAVLRCEHALYEFSFPKHLDVKIYYADHFVLPLPPGHRFPMAKYAMLRSRVATELQRVELLEPQPASDAELVLAHSPRYVERVSRGDLTTEELRAIGFPWSAAMVERSRRSAGATIAACRAALREGVAVNLAGGTHHAYHDHGEGYCVFNDAAVAARLMQVEYARANAVRGKTLPVAIIDLDVHQGNGTASILANDPSVFTLSLHGANNFPFAKERSDLDVALPDGADDDQYLAALDSALEELRRRFSPGLLIYLAGADVHEGDRLGKLKLSTAGVRERDARVFALARTCGAPLAIAMAGGYGRDIGMTVNVHFNTVSDALAYRNSLSIPAQAEQHP